MPSPSKKSQPRKNYSEAQNVALVTQVSNACPLCTRPLFRKKNKKSYKDYEIAHIYPLNPTPEEVLLLKGEEKLCDDVNHEDNVIPLCLSCHNGFDNPRAVEDYRKLFAIKKRLIEESRQKDFWSLYSIESQIVQVIERLYASNPDDFDASIDYDPKSIDDKFDVSISLPTRKKIKSNVAIYYPWLSHQMELLDKEHAEASQIISSQIKVFYLKQKQSNSDQQVIFDMIVKWIFVKTKPPTIDAAEIIASFFVQNCEILG